MDILGPLPSGDYIFVCVDYYSRIYEIDVMKTVTAYRVIQGLVKMFTTHELPVTVTSDNDPQFASQQFKDYLRQNGIVQRRVTPLWPPANGEVER